MIRVALVVGHTQRAQGARNAYASEYNWNFAIAHSVLKIMEAFSNEIKCEVITDNNNDYKLHLFNKVGIVNLGNFDLAISMHCNSTIMPTVNGTETWYFCNSKKGYQIARIFQNQILKNLGLKDRGLKCSKKLVILRETKCTAILLEPFFLSGTFGAVMQYAGFQELYALSIAQGLMSICEKGEV